MSIDAATVERIARLARIRIEDDQRDALVGELSGILSWVEQLRAIDTDGVAPMTSAVAHGLHWRADKVTDGDIRDKVLANAPLVIEGYFAVPKVIE
ncbi:MAG: Asp-tRNA(Asn)/Glu-tRNA(Gln) amidotransferase subunit GatC [Alphaproteobacteria bacterium]|nr:MAG: Asp-tRNA(Asn)/Glu-tRNA(Gln) amidotransferase subunit GatC [Alphaproteobacteria bacterium]